jgi:hypothetical protein
MTIDPDYTAPLHGLPRPALTQFDTRATGGNKLATKEEIREAPELSHTSFRNDISSKLIGSRWKRDWQEAKRISTWQSAYLAL